MTTTFIKYLLHFTYRPLLTRYLSTNRYYTSHGLKLEIPPQVFHPRFFTSTQLLLKYICSLPLEERSLLELGAGSGFISMMAEKKGAVVTATDINPVAVQYLRINRAANGLFFNVIQSDVFDNLSPQQFDIIAINPPYYRKDPTSPAEYAWFCGKDGEYFQRLFAGLADFIHGDTRVIMVLCDGCDIEMIRRFALRNKFRLRQEAVKKNLLEKTFIYRIEYFDAG